jgi:hypothetical protein
MNDLLLEYTRLLHEYQDPDAPGVRRFIEGHAEEDPVFAGRAKKLNALFVLKSALVPSASARSIPLRAAGPLRIAADDADSLDLINAEEGLSVRIYPAGKEGLSTVQFDGVVPADGARLYAGETPIEMVEPLNQFGYAAVWTEAVRPIIRGEVELQVRAE